MPRMCGMCSHTCKITTHCGQITTAKSFKSGTNHSGFTQTAQLDHVPELNVHQTPGGMSNLLKTIIRKIEVIDIATTRWVVPSYCGATPVKLQAGAVVCHMHKYRVVWLAGQA